MKTARFWIWYKDSYVKLTLKPNQWLSVASGGSCEEGYYYEWDSYIHEGTFVRNCHSVKARDCDGRLDQEIELICPLDQLKACEPDEYADVQRPAWETVTRSQRDYAAEACGY